MVICHQLLQKPKNRSSEPNEKARQKSGSLKRKTAKRLSENTGLPLIKADQYASRAAVLASLAVTWSPMIKILSQSCYMLDNKPSNMFALLAVGSKSGKISVWRFHAPVYYSFEPIGVPASPVFNGLLQAHNSWVTTMSFTLLTDSLGCQVLLASGSSDGRCVRNQIHGTLQSISRLFFM